MFLCKWVELSIEIASVRVYRRKNATSTEFVIFLYEKSETDFSVPLYYIQLPPLYGNGLLLLRNVAYGRSLMSRTLFGMKEMSVFF
jgi:hypothetical protein